LTPAAQKVLQAIPRAILNSDSLVYRRIEFIMTTSFSDRIGRTKPKTILQINSIDDDLRNGLWQACIEHCLRPHDRYYRHDTHFQYLMKQIYVDFFKQTSDTIPHGHELGIDKVRNWFFKAEWWSAYNFIEFLMSYGGDDFNQRVSFFLEREKSGYRIVNSQLIPITDPIEIDSISEATSAPTKFSGAQQHMQAAVSLFSQKPNPDHRNSIKEAISAVEATARIVTENPKATLGDALKKIGEKISIHPSLREAMNKLYGYTSDEGGIRHAMLQESTIDEAEAKFMIVACSAFVNFCVQRSTT
jgi:AbiJ N-terminal domain 4